MPSITIPAITLRTALAGISRVINRRCTLPVLGYVKIEKRNGVLNFTGTDLDLYLTYTHPTEPPPITKLAKSLATLRWAREAATLLVTLDVLRHAAKAASGSEPWVTITENTASWSTPAGTVSMPFTPLPVKEFPDAPPPPFCAASVNNVVRSAFVAAVTYSSNDETRYVLNGVYLETTAREPVIVATDGRRLYRCTVPSLVGLNGNHIFPSKALAVLSSPALMAHEWRLGANVEKLRAAIKAGPWFLLTKTIEGNYPNYRQVMPSDLTHWITAPIPEPQLRLLATSLDQFAATKEPTIALLFHGDHLRLQCPETGTSVIVPGVRSDAPLVILFDRFYFRDMLRCGPGTLFLQDAMSPCLYVSASGAEHVLMPRRGETSLTVPDPARQALEAVWKDKRISISEPNQKGKRRHVAEGVVLEIPRQGLRLDSALVSFDGENKPRTVSIAELTLLPPTPAAVTAA